MKVKLERAQTTSASGTPKLRLQKTPGKPVFISLFGDAPTPAMGNPLDSMVYPEGVEAAALAEAQAIREAFQTKYRGELDSFRAQDDPDYWFLVCFQTRAQKDAFLAAAGWDKFGGQLYLDGLKLAAALGVDIQPITLKRQTPANVVKILRDEVQT
jgi:hypothetical protein